MPEMTVGQAKNSMRWAARAIVEGKLTTIDKDAIWAFFDSTCAYCGKALSRALREGHLDHADPKNGNHLGNRVLACGPCNGNEKREEPWESFVARKDPEHAEGRAARIREWVARHPAPVLSHDPEVEAAQQSVEVAIAHFDAACANLRLAVLRARGRTAQG